MKDGGQVHFEPSAPGLRDNAPSSELIEKRPGRKAKALDPTTILTKRKKWKKEFTENLKWRADIAIYGEAIIRDVKRMDAYPEIDEKAPGISPWFKVEIKGLYHRGVEVFLRVESVKSFGEGQGWRWARYDEDGAVNALVVGKIPFDLVRGVEWGGDEYYNFPHIYCEFSMKQNQPYEEVVLCVQHQGTHGPYFTEIAKFDDVWKAD
jgi:hypothetical protein